MRNLRISSVEKIEPNFAYPDYQLKYYSSIDANIRDFSRKRIKKKLFRGFDNVTSEGWWSPSRLKMWLIFANQKLGAI